VWAAAVRAWRLHTALAGARVRSLCFACSCSHCVCLRRLLPSTPQAAKMLPAGFTGQWHFCRGMWQSDGQCFKSYAELGECVCVCFVCVWGGGGGEGVHTHDRVL
jgi:hypothetical protein